MNTPASPSPSDVVPSNISASITCAPSSTAARSSSIAKGDLAQIAADAVECPELARGRRRRRPPLSWRVAGGTRLLIRHLRGQFALSSIDGPVDLLDAHRIRRRRIDHDALAAQRQRIAVIELRRPRFLVEQRHALRDLPAHLADVAGAARVGDRLVDLIELRLELAFGLRRRLQRVVADRQRVDVRQRLRVGQASRPTGQQANRENDGDDQFAHKSFRKPVAAGP